MAVHASANDPYKSPNAHALTLVISAASRFLSRRGRSDAAGLVSRCLPRAQRDGFLSRADPIGSRFSPVPEHLDGAGQRGSRNQLIRTYGSRT